MNFKIKLTTLQWLNLIPTLTIYDPDGWNRLDPDWYSEPITFNEFMSRCSESTTNLVNGDEEACKRMVLENIHKILF